MRHFFAKIAVALSIPLALATPALAAQGKAIPNPPQYYVLDEPHVLSPTALAQLQKLLIEHDRATGEQFLVAIFNSIDDEDPVDYTNRVFAAWKIGQRGKDNGILLALYWKEHQSRIEVGYGLEGVLTDAKSHDILSDILAPELRAGNTDRGIFLASMEILRVLGSPLISGGRAQEILESTPMRHVEPQQGGSFAPWLLIGIILMIIVINLLTSADAQFTRAGWTRAHPFRYGRRSRGFWWGGWGGGGWGGGWGGGGGDGGFSGGGGSSGGGGASGSW